MKGIILAGGSGTRLYPATTCISKQLLPVYDKPMIYYPISVLMLSGIREILIISSPRDIDLFKALLGDGSRFGVSFSYCLQERPEGIAQAFLIAEDFIGNSSVSLILGDNLIYGHGVSGLLKKGSQLKDGARVYGYYVSDPERYGVVEFDEKNNVISLEEKPESPKSNYAVTGLYFYDKDVVRIAKELKPSSRGELEITDVNRKYLGMGKLSVDVFGRGVTWLDTGTHNSLLEASNFIQTIETRQGLKVACLEEIAFNNGWISKDQISKTIENMGMNSYSEFLKRLIK